MKYEKEENKMQIQKKIIPFISTFIIIIGLGLLVNLIPQSLILINLENNAGDDESNA